MTERDMSELAAGYALGSLSPEDAAAYEAFIASLTEGSDEGVQSRREAGEFAETAAILGLSAPQVTPPPSLKASLMAQIATTPQASPSDAETDASADATVTPITAVPTPGDVSSAGGVEHHGSEQLPVVGSAEQKARARWFRRPAAMITAAAAAIAIFVGGGAIAVSLNNGGGLSDDQRVIASIQEAPDRQEASQLVDGATATLVWSLEEQRSVLIMEDMPAPPSGKTYQSWYIDAEGQPVSAGTFEPSADGESIYLLEGTMGAGDTVGVTLEPSGGSKQPTTDPIVAITST